jgi:hypothetical protein
VVEKVRHLSNADGLFQLTGTAMSGATNLPLGEPCEPALDRIEPRGRDRREVRVDTWVTGRSVRILGVVLILWGRTGTTFGDDTLGIRVYNDTAEEIVVTVYDMNATPPGPVLVRQTINGFAWIPALVTPGFEGNGHVRWTAETTGTSFHRCGHAEGRALIEDAMLRVFTNSECVKGEPWLR